MTDQPNPLAAAIAEDPELFVNILDCAIDVWQESQAILHWLTDPQPRWNDRSPCDMIAAGYGETVLDALLPSIGRP